MNKALREAIQKEVSVRGYKALNEIARVAQKAAGMEYAPVAAVKWVPIEDVEANDYNPNQVAKNELRLLAVSINHDGYTQPVVTVFDPDRKKYVIIDGFHRYLIMKTDKEIRRKYGGRLPVVVLDKSVKDRMASTVRHNRARGKHSVSGMGVLVGQLRERGWEDAMICNELGLEADELVRLEHMTGVAALFSGRAYNHAWDSTTQIKHKEAGKK